MMIACVRWQPALRLAWQAGASDHGSQHLQCISCTWAVAPTLCLGKHRRGWHLALIGCPCHFTSSADQSSNCTTVEGFTFHAGQDSLGGDLASTAGKSAAELARMCAAAAGCRAFTTAGALKEEVSDPLDDWPDAGPCDGIYTRDMVDGELGLVGAAWKVGVGSQARNLRGEAGGHWAGLDVLSCTTAHQPLAFYAPTPCLSAAISAEPECTPAEVANYTFEAGKDSSGEELQVVAEFGSAAGLAAACAAVEGCAAFTTDGRLRAASDAGLVDWQGSGSGSCAGIYIRDEPPPTEGVEGASGRAAAWGVGGWGWWRTVGHV